MYQPGAVIQNNCNTWYVVSSSCIENGSTVLKLFYYYTFFMLFAFGNFKDHKVSGGVRVLMKSSYVPAS